MSKKNVEKISEEKLEGKGFLEQITLGVISDFINDENTDDIYKFLNMKRKHPELNENIDDNELNTQGPKKNKKKRTKKLKKLKSKNKK